MIFADGSVRRALSAAVVTIGLLAFVLLSVHSAGGAVVASETGSVDQAVQTQVSGTLSVDVQTGTGPIDSYVEVKQGGEQVASGSTGDDGEISFDVSAGEYTVTAHASNAISKEVSVSTGSTTPVTLTFATLEIDADSGYGEIETYSTVDTTDGEYIDGKAVPADDVATYHLDPGTYRAIVSEANEVSKEVALSAGVTTPVTLTFATLEIDADSGYGEIETYSTVDTTSGDYIDGKAVPADDVATYHLNPGTYRAIVSEANEVSKEVSLTAGTTTPVTLTFATLEIDADSGYGEIETYSTVDTTDGEYIDGKAVPADDVATYHLDPGTYRAIVSEANEVSKEVALSAGVTTPVTLTFATLEINADSGYGEIETYSTVDTTSGDYIDGKAVPADDVATYHLNPGTYRAIVSEANEVSKEVSLTAGTTTPVTLTFATLEIDADSGYGEIETYSTVDTTSGDYIDGKSVPADGVATYHLDPGTYQAIVSEANEVSREVSLAAGTTTPVTLTFATLEIDAEVGNRQLESYSTVDTTDGEYVDGKTVPVDGVATYHLEPGTYRAIASEANEISREVSTVAGETRSVGMVFGLLNVSASAGTAYASVQDTNGNYIDGKSVPAAGGTDFHLNPATYQLEVTDDDTDASVSDAVSVSSSVQTFATAQFGTGAVDVRTEALAAANFTFSDLTLSATDLPAGASLSVSATITNTGDTPGEYTAPFKLDGAVVETQGGRLGVDEETTVTFSTVMDTDGVYDVTVGNLTARPVTVGDGSSGQQQPTVEPQFTSTPDSPSVTEAITFDATQTTVSDGTIESYEWDFTGDGTVDATGAVVTHTFEQAGSYTVSLTVSVADGSQNTTSESITVGDSQTVVRLDPTSRTTGVGGTATYDVVVEGYESGIESYQFDTSVGSADTATITAVSLRGTESSDSASAIEFASDNTSVSVSADGAGHDNGVIATVSVTGERAGTTDLTVHSPVVADSLGNTYDIETSENATLTVESVPAVVGDTPARDLNGDASYEDINGDGSFDVVDVNAFFNHYQSQSVQTNSDLFDFTGDGVVDVADVRHLFSVIQQ